MGHLQNFRQTLDQMLAELPDDERKVAINFCSNEVLQSYKNGLRDAKRGRGDDKKKKYTKRIKNDK